jgi:ankyrin repeat protein
MASATSSVFVDPPSAIHKASDELYKAIDAVRRDDRPGLEALLDEHSDILNSFDDSGMTLCKAAAAEGALSCLRVLIHRGAKVSVRVTG